MLNAVIIEDEFASRNALRKLLEKHCPAIRVADNNDLDTITKGASAIRRLRPDVVFLDIRLSETNEAENGFALLEQVKEIPFELVFVTAFEQYGVQAINRDSRTCYFIRKPFDFDQVKDAVRRIEENLLSKMSRGREALHFCTISGKIALPSPDGTEYVSLSRVVMLEADGSVTKIWIWLEAKPRVVGHIIGWFEKQLNCHQEGVFFRTHSAFIANRDYVKLFRHEGKKAELTMENNLNARVSEDRKANVLEWLGQR